MSETGPDKDESARRGADESCASGESPERRPKEVGGRPGPDPTRYGDWEKAGRCIDF